MEATSSYITETRSVICMSDVVTIIHNVYDKTETIKECFIIFYMSAYFSLILSMFFHMF